MRGYGASDKPGGVEAYAMHLLVGDVLAVMSHAGAERAHVIGHDWGAAVAWVLTMVAGHRVDRLVAMSVGHPAAFRSGNLEQFQRSWYMLLFQFQGVAEQWLSGDDWSNFRALVAATPTPTQVVAELEATAALTPGLNYYRANVPPESWLQTGLQLPPIQVPTMGVWSSGDFALTEAQMTASAQQVAEPGATSASTAPATGCSSRRPTSSTDCYWTSYPPEERLDDASDRVRVVRERPVAAVGEDLDLGAGERLALAVGQGHREVGVVRAPHHQRRAVERPERVRLAPAAYPRGRRWRGRGGGSPASCPRRCRRTCGRRTRGGGHAGCRA